MVFSTTKDCRYLIHFYLELGWSWSLVALFPFSIHFAKDYHTSSTDKTEEQRERELNLTWVSYFFGMHIHIACPQSSQKRVNVWVEWIIVKLHTYYITFVKIYKNYHHLFYITSGRVSYENIHNIIMIVL